MSEAKKPEETTTTAQPTTPDAKGKPIETPAGAAAPADNADGLPKTQEELDALIEKRLARERRKAAAKPTGQPATPPDAGDPAPNTSAAQPAATTNAAPAGPDPATVQLTRDLLIANAKLEAFRSDLTDGAVDDAVELAVVAAEKDGDLSAEGVADALKEVLKRHPEWKKSAQDKGGQQTGGFKVGADAQPGAAPAGTDPQKPRVPAHSWNRFNHK